MKTEYSNKCELCSCKGTETHSRIYHKKLGGKFMYLCKLCWNDLDNEVHHFQVLSILTIIFKHLFLFAKLWQIWYLKMLLQNFEPTPGVGNIVQVLKSKQKQQIFTAGDFFLFDKNKKFDCIIMNPPFSSKSAFMDNAPKDAETKGMKIGYYI